MILNIQLVFFSPNLIIINFFLNIYFASSHKAILCYLQECGFHEAAAVFQKEATVEPDAGLNGLLEKKWTSVIRLQKKACIFFFLNPSLSFFSKPTFRFLN